MKVMIQKNLEKIREFRHFHPITGEQGINGFFNQIDALTGICG
jgi:hypothetical protein